MKSIAVFCASSMGNDAFYTEQAYELGKYLAMNHIQLVYGGAKLGLMGALANGALEHQGKVTGVIPRFFNQHEIAHPNLTELIRVDSMHERKKMMSELSEGVIAMPGGFGTFEELFEMLTWAQIGLHQKPVALLNTKGYYNLLLQFIDHAAECGFLKTENRAMVLVSSQISDVIEKMRNYQAPEVAKWILQNTVEENRLK